MGAWRSRRCSFQRLSHRSASSALRFRREQDDAIQIPALLAALRQCGCSRDLGAARKIHALAAESKNLSNVFLANNLASVFLKCGSLADARLVFDAMEHRNVVSWNTLILGHTTNREAERAWELFERMGSQGFSPTSRTYVAALLAISGLAEGSTGTLIDEKLVKLEFLERVLDLHSQARKKKDLFNGFLANRLIDTYAKCGSLLDARMVFDRMASHDVVSWTSIIVACVENGEAKSGLELFESMNIEPDARVFAAALKACSILSALQSGRKIHDEISKRGLSRDGFLCNSLLDFYGKCGSMAAALQVFESMSSGMRNLVTWSTLIAGYGRIGDAERVVQLFQRMREEGVRPDGITFLSLLRACGHGGFVEKAKEFFAAMVSQYGIRASLEHYHCMVDILGQANLLNEAVAMAESMPFEASTVTWNTILGACWKWRNVEVAKVAFEASLRLDATQGLAYVLMANVYRSVGMWEEHSQIIGRRNTSKPGSSSSSFYSLCSNGSSFLDLAGVVETDENFVSRS
ncbi:pentatricopeptide repeat-containing protein At2g13600-like [Selaginella moellendorffii]|uniref:pentatricopeptide repeat-containing protein At2g13600-like n=1 Tax=Selaginella moellendorffii TaxID=88036 RepID=UPI000D1C2387|nr:pentatricopeptide repeat-containing protein At2g13600-like [Selaginella moellendorffii]|eukprot:XP_024516315.1 pentatricopeptide repeat-containing protein At2g13600-like [Selaginella moellendorffii]